MGMSRSIISATVALILSAWVASLPLIGTHQSSSGGPFVEIANAQSGLPPLPAGWPTSLQIGRSDAPGGAASMKSQAPFAYRYQYLAGGANTGGGWSTWNPNGQF